jgi:hypothetical protein
LLEVKLPSRYRTQHVEKYHHACKIVSAANRGIAVSPRFGFVALLAVLGSPSAAVAQAQNDVIPMFGIQQDASIQAATRVEWDKLPPSEIGCINDALREQLASVENLIQRGVTPSDPRIGSIRLNCRAQLGQQSTSVSAYAVGSLALGARVPSDRSYRAYQCNPSDQFDGFIWCQKTRKERERRGFFSASYSILHALDGTVVYANRYQEPAFWAPNEVDKDIEIYSLKFGEKPRIITMPRRPGLPEGILAMWGKVVLDPLDSESLKLLAEGRRPAKKGYFIDFIGNFARSAKKGLPVYRLGGGPGFVWVASYDQKGRGTLRFSALDASATSPQLAATQAPTKPPDQPLQESPSIAPSATIPEHQDRELDRQHQQAARHRSTIDQVELEAKASSSLANAPQDLQFLVKGLRTADDFIKLAEETFSAVISDAEPGNGDMSADAPQSSSKDLKQNYQEVAFRNFRQCFFLSDSGCNRTYGALSGIMPTLNPALSEVVTQPDPIREFKYEGACFFSAAMDIKKSLLQRRLDGSYKKDQTGHVAYFLNFNGIDANSIKIIDAPEYIRLAFEPAWKHPTDKAGYHSPEMRNGFPNSPLWKSVYDRFVSSMIETTSIKKFVIFEKQKVDKFPSAPVSLLLADVGESTDEEHDWNPVNYHEEMQPFAIGRSSLKRFPVLAFEATDAGLIAENLSSVIQSCQNDK